MSAFNDKRLFQQLRINSWEIEILFYEWGLFRSNKDSALVDFLDDSNHIALEKATDSIIHIPFYIYR